MPDTSGSHTMEYSHAYLWRLGDDAGVEIYESPGRFACAPNVSAGVLTLAPRIKPDEGVYYGLVALDMDRDMEQVDRQELPVSVRPFLATRIGDNFAFSIEANYGYGGLLGTMGYYNRPGGRPLLLRCARAVRPGELCRWALYREKPAFLFRHRPHR